MKKQKFICQGTFDHLIDSDAEIPKGESMTVPDEALTIGEIMEQFTHGIVPDISKDSQYTDTEDIDDTEPNPIDLTDLDDMRIELDELHTKIDAEKAKKSEMIRAQELEKIVQSRLSAIANEAGSKTAGQSEAKADVKGKPAEDSDAQSK
jgi:hypothetical protein|nr:MAG: hypothetical protein [Microviridae sp.]WAE43944.1 MAG: hypothetical protein [Microviridae sp.]